MGGENWEKYGGSMAKKGGKSGVVKEEKGK